MNDKARGIALHQRLSMRIYLALLGALTVVSVLFSLATVQVATIINPVDRTDYPQLVQKIEKELPPVFANTSAHRNALHRMANTYSADFALYSADGHLFTAVGQALPPLSAGQERSGKLRFHPDVVALQLSDGRWLLARHREANVFVRQFGSMVLWICVVVALGAYPVVRRLTRRLERLQENIDAWGTSGLSARVPVEGMDEVAGLAASFNVAAERLEALVGAQKSLLANASHELRSPLARIRMAVELMADQASPALRGELRRNVSELDQLIDEVLLASRLDALGPAPARGDMVNLGAIVAEEGAHSGAEVDTAAVLCLRGDAKLLRRMVRNLLENARRYGEGSPVRISLASAAAGMWQLEVCDQGPGIKASERERIFEPFYRVPGASEADGGVGLGLSLVRQIASHHGGSVACLDNMGGGCCFRVTLPA